MRRYGWTPDTPDQRDHVYEAVRFSHLPSSVDLRSKCPPVYDQGELGSCTANAIAATFEFEQPAGKKFDPSRLFIYYNERKKERTINSDSGAMIRDGIRSVVKDGVCPETVWPYDIGSFAKEPPINCYVEAKSHQATSYARVVRSTSAMKHCLSAGRPFVFGFTVYESFESDAVAQTGIVPMPSHSESVLGGHAVMCVGYDSTHFIVRNSWGSGWGDHGYCFMPIDYLISPELSDDFWVIKAVES